MEWLKELLKKAGVEETKVDQIVGDINKALPEHFVPKARYNEVADIKKKLESDIAERDKQLEELSKAAGASEELKKQIEQLQAENKAAAEKYAAEIKDLQIKSAIKSAISGKVHDEDLVVGLIDKEKIVIDGDKVVGLEEQLKTLQDSKAFLFKQDSQPQPGFQIGGNGGQPPTNVNQDQLAAIFGNTQK